MQKTYLGFPVRERFMIFQVKLKFTSETISSTETDNFHVNLFPRALASVSLNKGDGLWEREGLI